MDALQEHGSVRKAAAALGIPRSTLHDWSRAEQALADASAAGDSEQVADIDVELDEDASQQQTSGGTLDSLTDPLHILAFKRYASLRANGVADPYATHAAQQIHPEFDLTEDEKATIDETLDTLDFAERLTFAQSQPQYVRDIYDRYAMDDAAIADLAGAIRGGYADAYIAGINDQLHALGRDDQAISSITDPGILAQHAQDADTWAQRIASSYNSDLASALETRWIAMSTQAGTAMRADDLDTAMWEWAQDRADWKSLQIAVTEAGRAYRQAGSDFLDNNSGLAGYAYVSPGVAECALCTAVVGAGTVSIDGVDQLGEDLHPGCPHTIQYTFTQALTGPVWTAQDGGD